MTTKRCALTRRLLEGLTDEEWRVVRTARANVFMGQGVSAKKVVEALQSLARWRTTISASCTIGCRLPPATHV